MKNNNDEFHLRIATSHAIAGALFYGMEIEQIADIITDTVEDYKKKWNEEAVERGSKRLTSPQS